MRKRNLQKEKDIRKKYHLDIISKKGGKEPYRGRELSKRLGILQRERSHLTRKYFRDT